MSPATRTMDETTTSGMVAVEQLEEYQRTLSGPQWLVDLRAAARAKFHASEWPTTSEEEWRRTNLSPFEFDLYTVPSSCTEADSPSPVVASHETPPPEGTAGRIDVVSGAVQNVRVREDLRDAGVVFGDLASCLRKFPQEQPAASAMVGAVRSAMERSLAIADNRLEYWHFAMVANPIVLYVPAGVRIDETFEIALAFSGEEVVYAPHLVVVLGKEASATVVRRVSSTEDGEVMLVDASELLVGDGARLHYTDLMQMNEEALVFRNDRGNVGRDGHVHRTEAALGADFVKTRYVSELTGPGADAVLNGLYFARSEQHMDVRTVQQHRADHTTSRAHYRGAVSEEGHTVYQGLIQVDATARGTDAYLTNKNLVLGESARADSIPSLNIQTDDVRCSHGSTTGKIDPGQIFYLGTRGYSRAEALRMLVEGHFEDLIRQTPESIQEELRALIIARTPAEL